MLVYTDSLSYAKTILGNAHRWTPAATDDLNNAPQAIAEGMFTKPDWFQCRLRRTSTWEMLFITKEAPSSNFDMLTGLSNRGIELPHGILCLSETGKKFHGFKQRAWATQPGNLHLTAFLSPGMPIPHFESAFMILPVLSVIHAIDRIPGLKNRAMIKWVNDILIDRAKVGGVLAQTQTRGNRVTGVFLGIGLNVESTPAAPPTPFTPKVTSLWDVLPEKRPDTLPKAFNYLIDTLSKKYQDIRRGDYATLIAAYRQRSLAIGQSVKIYPDESGPDARLLAEGTVLEISDSLELMIEGLDAPIRKGRLALPDDF